MEIGVSSTNRFLMEPKEIPDDLTLFIEQSSIGTSRTHKKTLFSVIHERKCKKKRQNKFNEFFS